MQFNREKAEFDDCLTVWVCTQDKGLQYVC